MNDRNHIELSVLAQTLKGFVVISGYDCQLYRELFDNKGWHRIDRPTLANGGIRRTESLWLSPRTASAIAT